MTSSGSRLSPTRYSTGSFLGSSAAVSKEKVWGKGSNIYLSAGFMAGFSIGGQTLQNIQSQNQRVMEIADMRLYGFARIGWAKGYQQEGFALPEDNQSGSASG
jgi:hypothetical protein